MKITVIPAPNAKTPVTVLVRMAPENVDDDKVIKKLDKLLRGTSALHVTPIIDDRIHLSLIFNAHAKRAGSPK